MQSVISASDAIAAGNRDAIIAGGVENMSRVPMGGGFEDINPKLAELYDLGDLQMGMTAEKVAEEYGVSREEQDEYAARSQQRAVEATEEGRFDDEIVPIETEEGTVEEDEGSVPAPPPKSSPSCRPSSSEDGSVTPGNAPHRSPTARLPCSSPARPSPRNTTSRSWPRSV